jgi:hypothetical protein
MGRERGYWMKMMLAIQEAKGLRFPEVIIDSTTIKVQLPGGGGKKGRPSQGVLRAGMSRKCHLMITTGGSVEEGFLRGGNVNDLETAPDLVLDARATSFTFSTRE